MRACVRVCDSVTVCMCVCVHRSQDLLVNYPFSSIEDLITRNADYLVNSIALKLRSGASQHPEALQVLQAVLTHGLVSGNPG